MKKQAISGRGAVFAVVVWVVLMTIASRNMTCLPHACGPWDLFLAGVFGAGSVLTAGAALMVAVIFFPSLQEDQDQ